MINININLLSPRKKARLQTLVKFIFSKHLLEIAIFTTAVVAIFMVWSWLVLQDGFANLATASTTVNKEYATYNKDIKEINSMVRNVNNSSKEFQPMSPYFLELASNLPDNIKLQSILLDRPNKNLELQGVAKTRDDLLAYQKSLKKIKWLGEVGAPASKLFQKENITFRFKTKVSNFIPTK